MELAYFGRRAAGTHAGVILGGIGVWVARMIWKERRVDTPALDWVA